MNSLLISFGKVTDGQKKIKLFQKAFLEALKSERDLY